MATQPLSDEKCQEALEATEKYGGLTKAAEALELPRATLQSRIRIAKRRGTKVSKKSPVEFPDLPSDKIETGE